MGMENMMSANLVEKSPEEKMHDKFAELGVSQSSVENDYALAINNQLMHDDMSLFGQNAEVFSALTDGIRERIEKQAKEQFESDGNLKAGNN
jgi:hypothetical protein